MTNDNDLIRRGDAMAACDANPKFVSAAKQAIADLPAAPQTGGWGGVTALPATPMGVKVKPLEWKECHEELRRKGQDFSARSPVRFYPISIHKKNDGWWLSTDQKTYPSLEAAQAAAFEIERDMVLAALAPSPAPTLGDALELLESHVESMDQETFLQFAYAMDRAMEPHDPKLCAAALAALQKGGA